MNDTIDVAMRRKRNLLVALIRSREGACKATLKEWSGLSMESVIRYTDELVREGFVRTAVTVPFCRKKSRLSGNLSGRRLLFWAAVYTSRNERGRVGFCGKPSLF